MVFWVAEERAVVEEFTCVMVHDCQGPMYLRVNALHAFGQDGDGFRDARNALRTGISGRGGMECGFGSSV